MHKRDIFLPIYLAKEIAASHRQYQSIQEKLANEYKTYDESQRYRIPALQGDLNQYHLEEKTTFANFMGSLEELVKWIDRHRRFSSESRTTHDVRVSCDKAIGIVTLYKKYRDAENDAKQAVADAQAGISNDGPSAIHFHLHERPKLMKPANYAHEAYVHAGISFAKMLSNIIHEEVQSSANHEQ